MKTYFVKLHDQFLVRYKLIDLREFRLVFTEESTDAGSFDSNDYVLTVIRRQYPEAEIIESGEVEEMEFLKINEIEENFDDLAKWDWI